MILFAKKLNYLFDAYKLYTKDLNVDSLVILYDKKGFNGAVNRGPMAFVDFLMHFENALGVDLKNSFENIPKVIEKEKPSLKDKKTGK
jgi:hypothetical protein